MKRPVKAFFDRLKADLGNYDKANTDEEKVLAARYFSSYRGRLVLYLPIGRNAFSLGIIFLGKDLSYGDEDTVKHEYGHTVQLRQLGFFRYIRRIGIPSVTAFRLDCRGRLPYGYYTAPWEAEADRLGGVVRPVGRLPVWTEKNGVYRFRDLMKTVGRKR